MSHQDILGSVKDTLREMIAKFSSDHLMNVFLGEKKSSRPKHSILSSKNRQNAHQDVRMIDVNLWQALNVPLSLDQNTKQGLVIFEGLLAEKGFMDPGQGICSAIARIKQDNISVFSFLQRRFVWAALKSATNESANTTRNIAVIAFKGGVDDRPNYFQLVQDFLGLDASMFSDAMSKIPDHLLRHDQIDDLLDFIVP